MDPVQRVVPWTWGLGFVLSRFKSGRLEHQFVLFSINISLRLYFVRDVDMSSFDHTIAFACWF